PAQFSDNRQLFGNLPKAESAFRLVEPGSCPGRLLRTQDRAASRPKGSRLVQSAGLSSSFYLAHSTLHAISLEKAARLLRVRRHRLFDAIRVQPIARPYDRNRVRRRMLHSQTVEALHR